MSKDGGSKKTNRPIVHPPLENSSAVPAPSSSQNAPQELPPSRSHELSPCRLHMWGKCTKGNRCRFRHEYTVDELKKVINFCGNYQNNGCDELLCKDLHATREEELLFHRTGQYPKALLELHGITDLVTAPAAHKPSTIPKQMPSPDSVETSVRRPPIANSGGEGDLESAADTRMDVEPPRRLRLANVNVPEHIVICLDVCYDDPNSLFRLGDGTTFTHLNMLKRVVEMFVHSKLALSPCTQVALVALRDRDARWMHGFTSSARELVTRLDALAPEESTAEDFQLELLLETLERHVSAPPCEGVGLVAPPFVVRVLLAYGRSSCVPRLPASAAAHPFLRTLLKHPYVYTDMLLAHEEDCALYRCEEVYDALQDLDTGYSYVFEVSRNATRIHDCMAKLLAHPLQRPLQKFADYTFPAHTD